MTSDCRLCPRNCGVKRTDGETGFCGQGEEISLARASLHMWEEPCISGTQGSGTIFFSGCNMGCVFCQNREISFRGKGKEIPPERLCEIFWELKTKGAHNINLVTPTHFVPKVIKSIEMAKKDGFDLPFVYNSGGYESVETLKSLEGVIDIYMPDFKYWESETAKKYASCPDYANFAKDAIKEMVRQCPKCRFDEKGLMKKGVIVRHMLIPSHVYEAKKIIKYLFDTYKNSIVYSIMSQYTPMGEFKEFPNLNRKVKRKEYDSLTDFCIELGIENAYIQSGESAKGSFIPEFDFSGV